MIIGACTEVTGRVASTAILAGRHVVLRFAARCNAMTRGTVVHDAGVVDKRGGKTDGVVATAAVLGGSQMGRHCRRFGGRINTGVVVVARFTRLHRCVNSAVVKNAPKTESHRAVAGGAIDKRRGMPCRLTGSTDTMAAVAAVAQYIGAVVVREGTQESRRGMTGAAFRLGIRVRRRRRFAFGHRAVVAPRARPRYTRMVKAAVRLQRQKMAGRVAAIAFDNRRNMKFGFTNGQHAVMAAAAISKHFLVIHKVDDRESRLRWRVTGGALITGGHVIRRLARNISQVAVMAIDAIGRQPVMKYTRVGWNRGGNQLHCALAANTFGTDNQLCHIGPADIGDETGIRCRGILQFGMAAGGPGRKRPLKGQRGS